MRLDAPARHVRSVLFIKGDYWIVRDRVETSGAHDYELNFHFDTRSRLSIETENDASMVENDAATAARTVVRARVGDACESSGPEQSASTSLSGLDLYAFASGSNISGAWREHKKLISTAYGAALPAPACTFAFSGGAAEVCTLLIPRAASKGTTAQYSAREIEAVGGRAFELKGAASTATGAVAEVATRDFVLVRADGARMVETARVASDFEWAWLRFHDGEAEPRELIASGGGSLRLDGREILRAQARFNYVVARRAGDELTFETDAGEDFFLAFSGAERVEEQKGTLSNR
jgi:hypothetical protein